MGPFFFFFLIIGFFTFRSAIFTLSLWRAPEHQYLPRGAFTCVWFPIFCGCHLGETPWSPGSSGQPGLQTWVSWDYNNQRDNSWLATKTRAQTTDWNTPPVSLVLLVLDLLPKAQALGLTQTKEPTAGLSGNRGQWTSTLCSLFALLQLAVIYQNKVYTLVSHLDYHSCCQGTPLDCLVIVASGAYTHGSQRTVTNRGIILKWLSPPRGPARGNSPRKPVFLCKRPISIST